MGKKLLSLRTTVITGVAIVMGTAAGEIAEAAATWGQVPAGHSFASLITAVTVLWTMRTLDKLIER